MKKISAFLLALMYTVCGMAESIIPTDATKVHDFKGYIFVDFAYSPTPTYYGDQAIISVYTSADKTATYLAFHDDKWGDGEFAVTMDDNHNFTGEGTVALSMNGSPKEYAADLSGSMTNLTITLPSVMGGTHIVWTYGDAPAVMKIAGTYQMASEGNCAYFKDYNPVANDELTITANADSETVTVSYANDAWGTASFENVTITYNDDGGYTLAGDGTWAMAMNGNAPKDYAASFTATINAGGKMIQAQILAPSVMGGFSLDFSPISDATTIKSATSTSFDSNCTFDLYGRRVDASYKGIVVRNGKKFIQK